MAVLARSGLGLVAVTRGDADAAEPLYDALEAQSGTASFFHPLTFDRLLGLLAVTLGRLDAALAHFAGGLAFCARAGYRPEYAWTASDCADALLERAGADDRARAVALQDEALGIARELGMNPLVERLRAHRKTAEA
jgi:ATP/maltotriose-dependent transcriptional regulator MalT